MTILDEIISYKYLEIKKNKSLFPVEKLEAGEYFRQQPLSLKDGILCNGSLGIIAEFKRKSPSRGIMNENAQPEKVCNEFIQSGASAISVLTDSKYFGGSSADLIKVRKLRNFPVLRKDFIVDEYQIIEARAMGADAILLIARIHQPERMNQLHRFAGSLGLEVLVEIHDENDISKIPYDTQLVGINSRNLASLTVDHENLLRLIRHIPADVIRVAESGIKSSSDYIKLLDAGFNGFLIGELFMNTPDPGKTCRKFITGLRRLPDRSEDITNKYVE